MPTMISFLLPEYRQRVLSLLLLHPEACYHVREIARLTNTTAGSLHRELSKLAKAKVLKRKKIGNQVYYRANIAFIIFNELTSILRKTSGIVGVLDNALRPLKKKIDAAFIFGSVGSGKEHSESDVDVLIIGNLNFTEAVAALYPAQTILRREINPKIYKKAEWNKLIVDKNVFVHEIIKKPKLFIIGDENDIK